MPEFVVPAESRSETGKNVNRRLRSRGLIPGVVYGMGKDAVAVAVSPRELGAILKSASGENTLFDLDLGGTRRRVILKEFQREPLRGHLLHADFYEVALDKLLEIKVHVELTGVPVGVKLQGGLVDFVTRELELECLPADIPEKILVDIAHLELGKHFRVSDLKLGDKVKVLTEADIVIAHVVLPRAEVVAETAAVEAAPEAGAAEPEVIKKGKTEKGEGEAEEKAEKDRGHRRLDPAKFDPVRQYGHKTGQRRRGRQRLQRESCAHPAPGEAQEGQGHAEIYCRKGQAGQMGDQHGKTGGLAGHETHMGQDMHSERRHGDPECNPLHVIHCRVAWAVGKLVGTVRHWTLR